MNIYQLLKTPVVQIETGDISVLHVTREEISHSPGKSRVIGWHDHDLKKDGQPDARRKPVNIGVRVYNGRFDGYRAFPIAKEGLAMMKREEIRALEDRLSAAKQELLQMYSEALSPV